MEEEEDARIQNPLSCDPRTLTSRSESDESLSIGSPKAIAANTWKYFRGKFIDQNVQLHCIYNGVTLYFS